MSSPSPTPQHGSETSINIFVRKVAKVQITNEYCFYHPVKGCPRQSLLLLQLQASLNLDLICTFGNVHSAMIYPHNTIHPHVALKGSAHVVHDPSHILSNQVLGARGS